VRNGYVETNGYFCVKDSTAFGIAIAKQIPGFLHGIEGPCIYADPRIISQRSSQFTLDDLKMQPEDESFDLDKIHAVMAQTGGPDIFFLKHSDYADQQEYRFIWFLSHDTQEDALFLECPEAIQFCEKVT
jgi:hypothetical protein